MATLKFWLNAFIPKSVPGYTKVIVTGKHMNKTWIPLPNIARSWPGNWNKDWEAGYLTDQRDFDNSITASSRMHCEITVEISTLTMVDQKHWSSGTTEVNLSSGVQTGFAPADMSRCKWVQSTSAPPRGVGPAFGYNSGPPSTVPLMPPGAARFQLTAAAGDPLVGMAADIDYDGNLSILVDPSTNKITVSFDGTIDEFPAYDCYAMYNNTTKTVFTNSPPPGNTVASLLGGADRSVSGSVTFP
jgi:hypothetical protein